MENDKKNKARLLMNKLNGYEHKNYFDYENYKGVVKSYYVYNDLRYKIIQEYLINFDNEGEIIEYIFK